MLRLLLAEAGLPRPEVNPTLFTEDGRFLARVDLLYRRWRVAVEYDGDQHRSSTIQYERDMERREALQRAAWRVVYVRSRGLFRRQDHTVERVRVALTRAGWRP
jgi:very-short-patch-repair endonuclease